MLHFSWFLDVQSNTQPFRKYTANIRSTQCQLGKITYNNKIMFLIAIKTKHNKNSIRQMLSPKQPTPPPPLTGKINNFGEFVNIITNSHFSRRNFSKKKIQLLCSYFFPFAYLGKLFFQFLTEKSPEYTKSVSFTPSESLEHEKAESCPPTTFSLKGKEWLTVFQALKSITKTWKWETNCLVTRWSNSKCFWLLWVSIQKKRLIHLRLLGLVSYK